MSAWGEMRRRSSGEQIRKEDNYKYITLDQIKKMLKSMKVGSNPDEYPPVYLFKVLVEEWVDGLDNVVTMYNITAMAEQHQDGTKDFYSKPVLNSFEDLMKKGDIIGVKNLFV